MRTWEQATPRAPLRILILEDNALDALLLERELRKDNSSVSIMQVGQEDAFKQALREFRPEVVLADHAIRSLDAKETLAEVRREAPEAPVIFVSGAIAEEAVELLRSGAADYLLKSNLSGLGQSVRRALQEAERSNERMRVEAASEECRRLLSGITEGTPDLIFVKDLAGRYVLANPALARSLGRPSQEILGKDDGDLFPPEAASRLQASDRRIIETGQAETLEETVPIGGGTRTFQSSKAPLRDERGRTIGIVGIARDVTDLRRGEGEILRLNASLDERVAERTRELREVMKELDTFAYSVAHDLRAPLRAIGGLSQALVEDYADLLPKMGGEYARRIVDAVTRMDRLIQELLAYSRLSRADMDIGPVDLGPLVEEILREMTPELEGRRSQVTVEGMLPRVLGHAVILRQVVTNLIANAIKFVAPGDVPRVRLQAETRGEWIRLWVEDYGIGIAPEDQGRLFRVFERLRSAESFPGTGIGLAIVKKAVDRMGGRVGVESEVGKGSRFWIELPRG